MIGVDGRARRVIDIEVAGPTMMHDFSLTEKYVVLYDLPVTFDTRVAAQMMAPRGLRLPVRLLLSALVGRIRIPDPVHAREVTKVPRDRRIPYRGWADR